MCMWITKIQKSNGVAVGSLIKLSLLLSLTSQSHFYPWQDLQKFSFYKAKWNDILSQSSTTRETNYTGMAKCCIEFDSMWFSNSFRVVMPTVPLKLKILIALPCICWSVFSIIQKIKPQHIYMGLHNDWFNWAWSTYSIPWLLACQCMTVYNILWHNLATTV